MPSAREGKVTRVAQWLQHRALGWQDVQSTFYTDSINDLSLMETVHHPVATNPDAPCAPLRRRADGAYSISFKPREKSIT